MPTKTTKTGAEYDINGKRFVWYPLDDNEERRGELAPVELPMRIKLKTIRTLGSADLDADSMFAMLETLVPGQAEVLDEMDLNDFMEMFTTWQTEYAAVTGATLGE